MHSTLLINFSLVAAALHLPVRKQIHPAGFSKRAVAEDTAGDGLSFIASLSVGTPGQPVEVILDTGSSDLWLATPQTCNTDSEGNAPSGVEPIDCRYTYNPDSSSSFYNTTKVFSIGYGDGSTSSGFYAQDTLSFGGATIDSANIAYADNTTASAVFGIGFQKGEACVDWTLYQNNTIGYKNTSCTPYSNIPIQLKEQGIISSTAYSIWLNDLGSHYGNVLFGGVDHSKYHGQLTVLPIEEEPALYYKDGSPTAFYPKYTRTLVTLNQVNLYPGGDASDILLQGALPVLLDTGSTQCSLPSAVVESLAKTFNAKPDGYGGYFLDCGVTDDAYIGFDFRGVEIQVPVRQFIRPVHDWNSDILADQDSKVMYCSLGASSNDAYTFGILGDNVLSSFYSVFDIESKQIALAPAIYNQDATGVEDISADGIPGAVEAPAYSVSFTSTFQVNTAPSVTFSVTPITTITGDTASVEYISDLTNTALGDVWNTAGIDRIAINNVAGIKADDSDGNGITDIEGFSITGTLPSGINSVYTAGAPSTLSTASTTSGANASSSNLNSSSASASATATVTSSVPTGVANSSTVASSSASSSSSSSAAAAVTSAASQHGVGPQSESVATVTDVTTVLTTYCPEATTLTFGSSVYTVTEATTLTVTYCPEDSASATPVPTTTGSASSAPASSAPGATTVTSEVTTFTTYCPEATTFSYGGSVYTVTEATTLTITSCPPDSSAPATSPATTSESKASSSTPATSEATPATSEGTATTPASTESSPESSPASSSATTSSAPVDSSTPSTTPASSTPASSTPASSTPSTEVPIESVATSSGVVSANAAAWIGCSGLLGALALLI